VGTADDQRLVSGRAWIQSTMLTTDVLTLSDTLVNKDVLQDRRN
jgi:hypothetical protein